MVGRFPSVAIGDGPESARASLRALDADRRRFTHVSVVDGEHLVGQIAMADLALAEPDTPVRALTTPTRSDCASDAAVLQRRRGNARGPREGASAL